MKLFLAAVLVSCISLGYGACPAPYTPVGDDCIFVVHETKRDFDGARDYCKSLAGDGSGGDLLSTPSCDQFTLLSRYMELNDVLGDEGSYYLGVNRPTSGSGWLWLTLEALPLGPPFWAYDKGNMDSMNCAEIDRLHNYQLSCSVCTTERSFICSIPAEPGTEGDLEEEQRVVEIQDHDVNKKVATSVPPTCEAGIQIGDHCYTFNITPQTRQKAEQLCEEDLQALNGFLFYPSDCLEFARIAHHLATDEKEGDYWIGAMDATGDNAWYWPNGKFVPLGVPYWAFDEPSHTDHGEVKEHCAFMNKNKKWYLADDHCDQKKYYICKYHLA